MDNTSEPTILTVCYPLTEDHILLGKKKLKPNAKHYVYGVGLYNGFGGHKKPNETIIQNAKRELKSESGISARKLIKVGVALVYYTDSNKCIELHYFITTSFRGTEKETDEMRPIWVNKKNIPLGDMWPNDSFYMHLILEGRKFTGYFVYNNPDDKKLLSHSVNEVDTLPEHIDHTSFKKSLNL